MASVRIENVEKSFGSVKVIRNVDIKAEDGEFVVLVGPSGCGKSTLLRMIAGLEEITSGRIRIGDRVVNNLNPKDRDIAMVFQNYALYPHMTVRENMEFSLVLSRMKKKPDRDTRVERAASNSRHQATPRSTSRAAVRRPATTRRLGRQGIQPPPRALRIALNTANGVAGMSIWSTP